jgi:hypothetical protein
MAAAAASRFIAAAVNGMRTLRNASISSRPPSSTRTPINSGRGRQHCGKVLEDGRLTADEDLQPRFGSLSRDDVATALPSCWL